ncbi:MAG: c-type cytochrome [Nitrospinota bacterium]
MRKWRRTLVLVVGVAAAVPVVLTATRAEAQKADVQAGKAKYAQFCASCHGATGKGDGPAAAALNPKPRDLTNAQYMSKVKDEDIFKIIKKGGQAVGKSPLMPPWGGPLSDQDISNITAYIRAISKTGGK